MKGRAYGYGTYRGRGRGSTGLKIVIGILVLVLILAVALFFLAERYMVYGDDGEARLEIPFLQKEERQEPEASAPLPPVVTATPEPEKPEEPERPEIILPVILPTQALYDGTAMEAVTEGGGTAALFDMKGTDGMLAWVSDEELAIAARVSADEPEKNEAIKSAAAEDGVYRIARISCFKDHELSNADLSLAMTTESGVRWLDVDSNRWLSPANATVQEYVIALCEELAELGFDEILLENAGYPTKGKLNYIKKDDAYDAQRFEEVITAFYRKLADELKDTGVVLSVVYDGETTALSGQSEENIKELGIGIVSYNEQGGLTWQK